MLVREPSPPQTVARPSPGEAESVNSSLWDFCGNQLSAARLVIAHALQSAKCDLQNHIPLCMGNKNVSHWDSDFMERTLYSERVPLDTLHLIHHNADQVSRNAA